MVFQEEGRTYRWESPMDTALIDSPGNELDFLSGDRFKEAEAEAQSYLAGPYAAIRVDGKNFSAYTRAQGYAVPYDLGFMRTMDGVARNLLQFIDGACFAYVQSDEVSVVFKPTGPPEDRQWWFGGKIQKLVSLAGAKASTSFLSSDSLFDETSSFDVLFDARALSLESEEDAEQYLRWRRFDAQKNSISMAASTLFTERELHGVSSRDRAEMLQGTELERLPDGFFNGRLHYRTKRLGTAWNPKLGGEVEVERTELTSAPATRETVENVVPSLLVHRSYDRDAIG